MGLQQAGLHRVEPFAYDPAQISHDAVLAAEQVEEIASEFRLGSSLM